MVTVTFTIPDDIATELNRIAVANGFLNSKAMVIAYLRATIRTNRSNIALAGIEEAAEIKADTDTQEIG